MVKRKKKRKKKTALSPLVVACFVLPLLFPLLLFLFIRTGGYAPRAFLACRFASLRSPPYPVKQTSEGIRLNKPNRIPALERKNPEQEIFYYNTHKSVLRHKRKPS
jgi:hypothetical protein